MKKTAISSLGPPLLVILSALFYILAYNEPKFFWFLALVALVPFFYLIELTHSTKLIFLYGTFFGVITSGGILFWFLDAYPLAWAGVKSPILGLLGTLSVWLFSSLSLGVFFGLWVLFFKKVSRGNWRDFLIAPSIWIIFEFVRSFVYSLVSAGVSSSYGPYWTFGFLGYPLVWSETFAAVAPLGGVYLLSFIGVVFNIIIFYFLKCLRRRLLKQALILLMTAVLIIAGIGMFENKNISDKTTLGNSAIVAVVSTNFPPRPSEGLLEIANKAEVMKKNLSLAAELEPDIIVLPEDSRALLYLGTTTVDKLLSNNKNILLVDSSVMPSGGGNKEQMFFYQPSDISSKIQEKHFLVPYGEYLPYHAIVTTFFFHQAEWVSKFNSIRGYKKGNQPIPHRYKKDLFGALFCSEIIPENFYRKLAKDGAGLFLNVSSQAVFQGNSVLHNQTLSLAKMKATANRRYFVSAGNFAPSFVLNERGKVVTETKRGENRILTHRVPFNYEKSVYTRFGDWILLLAIIVTAVAYRKRSTISK